MTLLSRYKAWVVANSTTINAAEGALRSLTWLLPDRFSESELALEGFHSLLGFLSLYHEAILKSTHFEANAILPWPFWIGALQKVEVLVEMASISLHKQLILNKYTPLALLEALKATLRLITLHRTGSRLLMEGGVAATGLQNSPEIKIKAICGALARFHRQQCLGCVDADKENPSHTKSVVDPRKPSLSSSLATRQTRRSSCDEPRRNVEGFWWEQAPVQRPSCLTLSEEAYERERQSRQQVLDSQAHWKQLAGRNLLALGELTHILRPLLYVLALRRWGRRSWKPWGLSLALEAASAQLTSLACVAAANAQHSVPKPVHPPSLAFRQSLQAIREDACRWAPAEQQELNRRKLLFLYYLIRSPLFDVFTRRGVEIGQGLVKPVPLVGALTDKAAEILLGIQQYYSYTSAS